MKKIMMKVLALMTAVATLTGCGNVSREVSAMLKDSPELTKAIDSSITNKIKDEIESMEEAGIDIAAADIAELPTDKEDGVENAANEIDRLLADKLPDVAAEPAIEAEPESISVPDETKITETAKTTDKKSAKVDESDQSKKPESSKSESSKSESSKSESQAPESQPVAPQAPEPQPTPEPQPAAPPEPVHTHVWKEHVATTQTWVPNIVIVEDYETQRVAVGGIYTCTGCGYETTDHDSIVNHVRESILAGTTCGSWGTVVQYEDQQVLVGTHEEDQGHYETTTYVDYYYCDCGATK